MGIGWPADKRGSTASFPYAPLLVRRGARHVFSWQSSANWPHDTADQIFLGRAVEELGHLFFPEEWHNTDICAASGERRARADKIRAHITDLAARGVIESSWLSKSGFRPIPAHRWATVDQRAAFDRCDWATERFAQSHSSLKLPIYLSRRSWANRPLTDAERIELLADKAAGDILAGLTLDKPPGLLPPEGFMSMDNAVGIMTALLDDDSHLEGCSAAENRLRQALVAGRIEAVLQVWRDGRLLPCDKEAWAGPKAPMYFEKNGAISVSGPGMESEWAYARLREPDVLAERDKLYGTATPPENIVQNIDRAPTVASNSLTPKVQRALQALTALYPDGLEGVPEKTRSQAVSKWLTEKHPGVNVSNRVISAAASLFRSGRRA
jgi:hypothetical protein